MIRYATNWMGPTHLGWYRDRGLLEDGGVEPTTLYSSGRIDIYNVADDPYGHEYGLAPMHDDDWAALDNYLSELKTEELLPYDTLIERFEVQHGKKIRWA